MFYSKTNSGYAVYYDPLWHYIVPGASLAVSFLFLYMAAGLCYKDIRTANYLALSDLAQGENSRYGDLIGDCYRALQQNPNDAAAHELRGDAHMATADIYAAIADYSEAARLRPDRHEILRKRAKAKWLYGRDIEALRDWLKSLF